MSDSSSLADKLAGLVVVNYPCLEGTNISTMNHRECAEKGTPEQRSLARDVREVMEDIWALPQGHPVKELLEDFLSRRKSMCHAVVESSDGGQSTIVAQRQLAASSRWLPTELILPVLDMFMSEVSPPGHALQFIALGRLLLVNKSIAGYAKSKHAELFKRYTDRVFSNLLAVKLLHTLRFASFAYSFATLLGPVTELAMHLRGHEIGRLDNLLPLFAELTTLSLWIPVDDLTLCGLQLGHNARLRTLRVEPIIDYMMPTEWLKDVKVKNTLSSDEAYTLNNLREAHIVAHDHEWSPPPSLRQLQVRKEGKGWPDGSTVLCCLGYLVKGGQMEEVDLRGAKIQPAHLRELSLTTLPSGTFTRTVHSIDLSQNLGINDEAVRELDLGRPLTDLNLSRCTITDPSTLALASNRSLTRLQITRNPLSSGNFGLRTNTTLRMLDCSLCPYEASSSQRQLFLKELSDDLKLNTALEELRLSGMGMRFLDDLSLAQLDLADNTGLRRLDLTGNPDLTPASISAVRSRTSPALQEVFLTAYKAMVKGLEEEEQSPGRLRVILSAETSVWGRV